MIVFIVILIGRRYFLCVCTENCCWTLQVYPGLMVTSGLIHHILHSLNIPIHIRDVCVFLAPLFRWVNWRLHFCCPLLSDRMFLFSPQKNSSFFIFRPTLQFSTFVLVLWLVTWLINKSNWRVFIVWQIFLVNLAWCVSFCLVVVVGRPLCKMIND